MTVPWSDDVISPVISLQGGVLGDLQPVNLSDFWSDTDSSDSPPSMSSCLSEAKDGLVQTFLALGGVQGSLLGILLADSISAGLCSGDTDLSIDHLNKRNLE